MNGSLLATADEKKTLLKSAVSGQKIKKMRG